MKFAHSNRLPRIFSSISERSKAKASEMYDLAPCEHGYALHRYISSEKVIVPLSTGVIPEIKFSIVVLPAPLGPMNHGSHRIHFHITSFCDHRQAFVHSIKQAFSIQTISFGRNHLTNKSFTVSGSAL